MTSFLHRSMRMSLRESGPRSALLLCCCVLTAVLPAQELAWAHALGAVGDDVSQSLALDPGGNVLVGGYFEATVDLDPGTGEVSATSNGGSDAFVQKFNADG